ncbi:MAG: M48 family metalloprotease [Balneolaceae bacterium]
MKRAITHLILFLSVMLFASACAMQKNPVTGQNRLLAYSWEQEVQIGQEVDQEIIAEYGLYENEVVEAYIEELGEKILAESHMRREDTDEQFRETEFYFKVLDSPVVNAFALPGGYVYVTRGLMVHLNNEAQLAVVIGHEIGHVAARHASQRALQQQLGQVAVLGGAILGQELLGLPGQSILNLSSQAAQLLFLSYGRDAERESDQLGVEYAAMSEYAAAEGAEFFTSLKRISDQSGQSIPSMLSTHPDPGEREQRIPELAERWKEEGYEQTVLNKESYYDVIDGMLYGENPRNGFVEDGNFLHPELEFQFPVPNDWQLINQAQQVVMLSSAEDAVMIFRIDGESQSAQGSIESFVAQEGITLNSDEPTDNGYLADVTIEQQEGNLRAIIYAIEFQDRVFRFVNYSTEGSFDNYQSTFTSVPGQLTRVTDEQVLNIEPIRLQLVTTDRSGTFRSFLPSSLPMNIDEEELAIINQVELDEEIEVGTELKIPVQ